MHLWLYDVFMMTKGPLPPKHSVITSWTTGHGHWIQDQKFQHKRSLQKTFENLHCLERKTAVQQWDISMSHLESEPSWAQHLAVHRNTSKPPGFILSHRKIAVFLAGKMQKSNKTEVFHIIPYIFLYNIWSPRCFLLVFNGHTAVLELLWFQYCQQAGIFFLFK